MHWDIYYPTYLANTKVGLPGRNGIASKVRTNSPMSFPLRTTVFRGNSEMRPKVAQSVTDLTMVSGGEAALREAIRTSEGL